MQSQVRLRNHHYEKASGGDGIPAELAQILKDDAVKVMHSICQQIWKTQQWPQDCKRSVFIPVPKKGSVKECSNYCIIALISHASKVMLKILQARLEQYMNREPWTARCSSWILKRQRNQRIKLVTFVGSSKKQENSRKTSASLTTLKPLTVWITTKWKIIKETGISDHLTCLLRNQYAGQEATVRTRHGTTDWFQIGKGVHQSCILSPCLFNLHAE